jgi:hypothetical protein
MKVLKILKVIVQILSTVIPWVKGIVQILEDNGLKRKKGNHKEKKL